MKRRQFVAATAMAGVGGILAAAAPPAVHAQKRVRWKMVTTWLKGAPAVGESAELIARRVSELTGGLFRIRVFGAGQLAPAMGAFDAMASGTAEASHGASYFWAGKIPAAHFFTTVPWGMNAQQTNAWFYHGGGIRLWNEMYRPLGVVAMPAGNSGVQMGGWFKKEIRSASDFRGLKFRMAGLGGSVIARLGANVVLLPPSEIFTALERNVVDAAEWIGPFHDKLAGLYQAARFYYYPGWNEPSATAEFAVNARAYEKLPRDYRTALHAAAAEANAWTLSRFEAANSAALPELVQKHGVQLRRYPDDLLRSLYRTTREVLRDFASRDKTSAKVYESYRKFHARVDANTRIGEAAYLAARAAVSA